MDKNWLEEFRVLQKRSKVVFTWAALALFTHGLTELVLATVCRHFALFIQSLHRCESPLKQAFFISSILQYTCPKVNKGSALSFFRNLSSQTIIVCAFILFTYYFTSIFAFFCYISEVFCFTFANELKAFYKNTVKSKEVLTYD